MALFCFCFQLKLSFTLDKETMMPQGCYVYQYRDSNKWVATAPKSNVWKKKNPSCDTNRWNKNAVNLYRLTTSYCSPGWWRSSCCWLTSPQHTTSTRNSLSWLCSGATLHPKPKWWMSCRSSATNWESTSICPQQELWMSVDRLLHKSSFFLFDLLIFAGLFKWLNKENRVCFFCLFCFSNMQKSLIATVGDDEYSTARKEVLTHMCSRPMQVRAQFRLLITAWLWNTSIC